MIWDSSLKRFGGGRNFDIVSTATVDAESKEFDLRESKGTRYN